LPSDATRLEGGDHALRLCTDRVTSFPDPGSPAHEQIDDAFTVAENGHAQATSARSATARRD
jgi:hypothetical protein